MTALRSYVLEIKIKGFTLSERSKTGHKTVMKQPEGSISKASRCGPGGSRYSMWEEVMFCDLEGWGGWGGSIPCRHARLEFTGP